MSPLDAIAERRIREAQQRGEFDDLPGAGRPLALDDDALVPQELRAAYRLLRNAGFVPPALEPHRELRDVERLLLEARDDGERGALLARMHFLLGRAGLARHGGPRLQAEYAERLAARFTARRR
jgi:hypothetical protein